MAKEWYFLLAKHCLEEFKLDCQLWRLTARTIKGYYNNITAERHSIKRDIDDILLLLNKDMDIDLDEHDIEERALLGYEVEYDAMQHTGLKSHPQYALVQKQQRGNTGLITFEIKGSTEDAKKVINSLKVFKIGVSWGGFESLACMPHMRLDEQTCQWLGGRQNLIRIHCGLEGTEALIADLEQALANI